MSCPNDAPAAVSPWQAGRRAAKQNFLPGLILQVAAASLLIAYSHSAGLRVALQIVADWKEAGGYGFAAASGAVFCGVMPWLFRMAFPQLRPTSPISELIFGIVWWALLYISTDAFYQAQARVWGGDNALSTIAAKVLTDAFIYTPFWAAPLNALAHRWKALGCPWDLRRHLFNPGWYRRIVLPNLLPNWMVWIPGVSIIYGLPTSLQLPVASLIGCFWALLCIGIASPDADAISSAPAEKGFV